MKLELEIDGQMIEAEFVFADNAAQLTLGGETHAAQVSEPEPGLFTVIINNRVYRCAIEKTPSGDAEVIVNCKRISVAVRDKNTCADRQAKAQAQADESASHPQCPAKSSACCSTPETKLPRTRACW